MSRTRQTSIRDNRGAPAVGPYCHVCGQSAHNRPKHLGHAEEEVFESFRHLDGRVFRILRDLCVPGRVVNAYLEGKRVRYLPPLRIFVILSLFIFFLAHQVDRGSVLRLGSGSIEAARTEADVERLRAGEVARIAKALESVRSASRVDTAGDTAGEWRAAEGALLEAESCIRRRADQRIAEIRAARGRGEAPPMPFDRPFEINGKPWHAQTNPLVIPGAPAFVNGWLNHRAAPRALANVKSLANALEKLTDAWLSAISTALFFLVPVFAPLLRLAYPFTPWKYLEHLVVALYSYAFLLLAATVMLSLALLAQWTHWGWLARLNEITRLAGTAEGVAWLFATRWRVYRQPWWLTAPKFLAIGFVYSILVGLGALVALVTMFLK